MTFDNLCSNDGNAIVFDNDCIDCFEDWSFDNQQELDHLYYDSSCFVNDYTYRQFIGKCYGLELNK
jgi:hypothetical protein